MTESSPSPRRRRRRPRRPADAGPGAATALPTGPPRDDAERRDSERADATGSQRPDSDRADSTGSQRRDSAGAERPDSADGRAGKARRRGAGRPADGQPGRDSDRGWRELLGNAPSQVGVSGAMRARDVARPDSAELAAAERDLVIARRQWRPPEETGR